MSPTTPVGGVVLAGGAGRRYGRPKATVVWEGETLVERAVAALQPWCDAGVVVVGRPEVALPTLGDDVHVVHDREGRPTSLLALATGLSASTAPLVLVLAVDLPQAAPLLPRLLEAGAPAVAIDDDDRVQPLCGLYERTTALEAAEAQLAEGNPRLVLLAEGLHPTLVRASAEELRNLNTPED